MALKSSTDESTEYVSCVLCDSDNSSLLFASRDWIHDVGDTFNVVECQNCDLVYINPRPTKNAISAFYPQSEYYTCQPQSDHRGIKDSIKHLIRASQPGYNKNLGVFKTIMGRFLALLFAQQIDIMVPFKTAGRILDVGCGNGQLTSWMGSYGWQTFGVDITEQACQQAEIAGLNTFCGEVELAPFPDAHFDAIVVNHVLEHVHDPISLLKKCNNLLREDGIIIVDVPNLDSYQAQVFDSYWDGLDSPRHLYNFRPKSLLAMLDGAGFKVNHTKFKAPFPLLDRQSLRHLKKGSARGTISIWLKSYLLQPVIWLVYGRPKVSTNLTVYASKSM